MQRANPLVDDFELGTLNKVGHANFCMRCLTGLPSTMAEADPSRVAVGFYCLGALDILGLLETKVSETDREAWRSWIWAQQIKRLPISPKQGNSSSDVGPDESVGMNRDIVGDGHIGGFRPGPFMHVRLGRDDQTRSEIDLNAQLSGSTAADADPPHLIMTYTALLSLSILRDDFTKLDRDGLINLLHSTQRPDGSFTSFPGQGESDIRMVYTAFAISAMLDNWRGINVPRAIQFVKNCMSYEGGFGQVPGNETQGGSTYCALATLALAPPQYRAEAELSASEKKRSERWLVQQQKPRQIFIQYQEDEGVDDHLTLQSRPYQAENQRNSTGSEDKGETISENKNKMEKKKTKSVEETLEEEGGGFAGRTEKLEDACYSFWCGAALRILQSGALGGRGTTSSSSLNSNERERKEKGVGEEDAGGDEDEDFVDRLTHARFLSRCQFRLGGLSKAPGVYPDPYHTYLALAAVALYPPPPPSSHLPPSSNSQRPQTNSTTSETSTTDPTENELLDEMKVERRRKERETWKVRKVDPLINATEETARWAREKISGKPQSLGLR